MWMWMWATDWPANGRLGDGGRWPSTWIMTERRRGTCSRHQLGTRYGWRKSQAVPLLYTYTAGTQVLRLRLRHSAHTVQVEPARNPGHEKKKRGHGHARLPLIQPDSTRYGAAYRIRLALLPADAPLATASPYAPPAEWSQARKWSFCVAFQRQNMLGVTLRLPAWWCACACSAWPPESEQHVPGTRPNPGWQAKRRQGGCVGTCLWLGRAIWPKQLLVPRDKYLFLLSHFLLVEVETLTPNLTQRW